MTLRLTRREFAKLQNTHATKQPAKRAVRRQEPREGRGSSEIAPVAPGASERLVVWVAALPPSVNHMYVNDGRGGKVLGQGARTFRQLVATACQVNGYAAAPGGDLALTMRLTYPDRRKSDLDNRIKSALDALALALDFDDRRVVRIVAERVGVDPGRPACELVLEAL